VSIQAEIFLGKTGRATNFGEKIWTGDLLYEGIAGQFFPVQSKIIPAVPVPVFPGSTGKYAGGYPVPVDPEKRVSSQMSQNCSFKFICIFTDDSKNCASIIIFG